MINFQGMALAGLPMPLAEALAAQPEGLGKRERTRRQLLAAAVQAFSASGVGASTMQEIARQAGMTPSTVYNHFSTKEEVVQAVAVWLAETMCERIADSQVGVAEGARRMAIGNRRYLWLARQSPAWALLMMDVAAAAPQLLSHVAAYALADLRLGQAQGVFKVSSEAAALDMIMGTCTQAMRTAASGAAPPDHDITVAAMVLRGLGMSFAAAEAMARRPLPDFGPPGASRREARNAPKKKARGSAP
jgi:AcrR family transcriptional regulator